MKLRLLFTTLILVVILLVSCTSQTAPTTGYDIPSTSACAITAPPVSMEGINTHPEVFGTDADPAMITLGPKLGMHPKWPAYSSKISMEFELEHGTPVLAPIDMTFIGFSNNNAEYRIQNGEVQTPYNDLLLCFESDSPDWPGMIICVYHLITSPLLVGHYVNPECSECEEWGSTSQVQGHVFYSSDDVVVDSGNTGPCEALIGYKLKRGDLIGFAGSVGTHSMAAFCFKVSYITENPTVRQGNPYLHWVQPSVFFYWKSYSPAAFFPGGVLAYPFECDGYQLPEEQQKLSFKYTQ